LRVSAAEDKGRSLAVAHGLSGGLFEPWKDYREADWISLDTTGTPEAQRVVAITLEETEAGDFDVELELNSVEMDAFLRLNRRLDALMKESTSTGGGGVSGSTGTSSSSSSSPLTSRVASVAGDSAGYLFDKLETENITKSLVGATGAQRVKLSATPPASSLDSLTDVDTSSTPPDNGNALVWDDALQLWVPGAGGGGTIPGAVDYSEDNTQISASASQTILSRTVVLPAGTYLVLAKVWVFSAGVGTLSLRKGGVIFGGNDDPRSVIGNRVLFATFVHTGGSVTVDIYHAQESGTTQYGANGDARFGRELQIISIGGTGASHAPHAYGTIGTENGIGVKTLTLTVSGMTLVSTTRLRVDVAGQYLVHAQQLVQGSGGLYWGIRKNGVDVAYAYNGNGFFDDRTVTYMADFAVDDYVEVYQSASVTNSWAGPHSSFAMYQVRSIATGSLDGDAVWQVPTLAGSWTNYGSGYNPAGYRKDASGFVHLRGLVTGGSAVSTIFTLPVGYRPAYRNLFMVQSVSAVGRVDVATNGVVEDQISAGSGWVSLDGITFLAEA
jgi:hypothetical protein